MANNKTYNGNPEQFTKAWYCKVYKICNSTLQKWFKLPAFAAAMQAAGYNKWQKRLTPLQHKIFEEHFDKNT